MNREYHKWFSWRLGREMELLIFGHAGEKMLVFPTRCGRFYEYENLGMIEVLRERIEAGELQVYCLDGIDTESFYCWWAHPSGRINRAGRFGGPSGKRASLKKCSAPTLLNSTAQKQCCAELFCLLP